MTWQMAYNIVAALCVYGTGLLVTFLYWRTTWSTMLPHVRLFAIVVYLLYPLWPVLLLIARINKRVY